MGEEIAAHPVVGFQMPDDRLDGGASPQFTLDGLGDTPFLARDEYPELVFFRKRCFQATFFRATGCT